MPDGKLYVYPGLGTGQVDVGRRMEILLPPGAPDPARLSQIVVTEDVTGDGLPDMFALADGNDTFWAFTGYTGASFTAVRQVGGTGWGQRNLVGVRDISGDNVPDLLFRNGKLVLRKGKPGADGGVDLVSIATAAASNGGADSAYAASGWGRAAYPKVLGTRDATGDGIPDVWAVDAAGKQWLFKGQTTALSWASGAEDDPWNTYLTIG
ncbi:FG-GAP-like repeat-containing protein [Streptomyces sp. NPDC059447]|uniref:FG-GAP-like repeat-containing protein n=1 Tax=Streptomyces sp. NPDC059447 TaxID=3346834 RepID=UPI00368AEDED